MGSRGRKVVAYLTQYGYWWSCDLAQWENLIKRVKQDQEYNLSDLATALSRRPAAVSESRWEGPHGHLSAVYYSNNGVPIFRCLDFDIADWLEADAEVRQSLGE